MAILLNLLLNLEGVDGCMPKRYEAIGVNMGRKKCGTFSYFRWLSTDIYQVNILRNPNQVDDHFTSAKPK